ncbi:MAG: DUF2339 domain-containing protein [Coriobacteriales bacterium]|jgi:hypothetical protein|nr:DUF2339 domain-containing protein [Coriobacteriales bacterium]
MGRTIAGIIAAVLVFLGLVFLGLLVVPTLTDDLKVSAMFSISLLLWLAGFLLIRRIKNGFTLALLGTGLGAVFISILVTHLFFGMLSAAPAYLLLLAWLALSLVVTKLFDSVSLSVIAHIGMVFSVIAGYLNASSVDTLYLLLAYQAAATVLLVLGTFIANRRTHLIALFVSLMLCLPVSTILWQSPLLSQTITIAEEPLAFLSAFGLQFVGASALYLITLRAIVTREENSAHTLMLLASVLWLASGFASVTLMLYRWLETGLLLHPAAASTLASFATVVIVSALGLAALVMLRRLSVSRACGRAVMGSNIGFSALLLLVSSTIARTNLLGYTIFFPSQAGVHSEEFALYLALPGFLLVCLSAVAAWFISRDRLYWYLAVAAVLVDLLLMIDPGFARLAEEGSTLLALGYLALLLALLGGLFAVANKDLQRRWQQPYVLCVLLAAQLGLSSVLLNAPLPDFPSADRFILLLLLHASLLLLARLVPFIRRDTGNLGVLAALRVDELVVIAFVSLEFIVKGLGAGYDRLGTGLALAATILLLAIAVLRIVIRRKASPGFDLAYALAATLLLLSCIGACTKLYDEAYALSLVAMILAFANIAAGFALRRGTLRIYGLVLVLVCVIKLLIIDLVNLNSVMRVIAFIGCGLICFGISALYNFAVKRLRREQTGPKDDTLSG